MSTLPLSRLQRTLSQVLRCSTFRTRIQRPFGVRFAHDQTTETRDDFFTRIKQKELAFMTATRHINDEGYSPVGSGGTLRDAVWFTRFVDDDDLLQWEELEIYPEMLILDDEKELNTIVEYIRFEAERNDKQVPMSIRIVTEDTALYNQVANYIKTHAQAKTKSGLNKMTAAEVTASEASHNE